MECPHCRKHIYAEPSTMPLGSDGHGVYWGLRRTICPACNRFIFYLLSGANPIFIAKPNGESEFVGFQGESVSRLIYPKGTSRPPCPVEVPKDIADDYTEACLVLADSPKASAALSRRCLQHVLRAAANATKKDLAPQIDEVLNSGKLDSHASELLHLVREIGNLAAHPIKSTSTGEIVPVEPHEAETNLEVLEALFDFYYVQPAKNKKRKDELNQKLQAAGRKPIP
jgi:hypothetical protein